MKVSKLGKCRVRVVKNSNL